jgi:tetratricopeptide (TPR) repeat protein
MLAAGVLLLAAGAVGAWLLYQQRADARARQARTDQEVRAALDRAHGLLEEGWRAADLAKVTQARREANRAADIARSGDASAAARQAAEAFRQDAGGRLERLEKDRALLEAVQDVSVPLDALASRRDAASWPMGLAQPGADEQYAAAFGRWGLDVDGTAEAEVVARLGAEPDAVVQELIAGLDCWMLERRRQQRPEAQWRCLFRVAEQLDGSERRRRLRALLAGGAPPRAEGVAGLVGLGSPWPALRELAHGSTWRPLLELRRQIDPRTEPALRVVLLASACAAAGDAAGAEQALRQAVTARPEQVALLGALGKLLERQGPSRLAEAIGYYRAARSRSRHLGLSLSRALIVAGKVDEAEEVLQELLLQPAHDNDPGLSFCLGAVRMRQYRYGEAEAAYREAIRHKPGWGEAHSNLGAALNGQRKYGQAEAACRKALDLKPDNAVAYTNLGNALVHQGKPGEAEAACRKALDLRPDDAEAYNNFGNALDGQAKRGAAEAAYRKALDLRPDLAAGVHNNLGYTLLQRQRYAAAEAACRKAIELSPDFAVAYCNLGLALQGQARFDEGAAALKKAGDLAPATDALRGQARQFERQCQRLATLAPRLPAILKGTDKPANAVEQLEFARLCLLTKHYAAAARLSCDAFARDPKLAGDVPTGQRYAAACAAALAGCGHGKDEDPLDEKQRALWRRQALDWLRQDLTWWGRLLDRGGVQSKDRVQQAVRGWLTDDDLAGLREPSALEALPADERKECLALWQEVAGLLGRAQTSR